MFDHLINYDALQHPVVNSVAVSVQIRNGKKVERVSILSPDENNSLTVAPRPKGQRMEFTVPRLAAYRLGVINWG